jgi:hypothetical protein
MGDWDGDGWELCEVLVVMALKGDVFAQLLNIVPSTALFRAL